MLSTFSCIYFLLLIFFLNSLLYNFSHSLFGIIQLKLGYIFLGFLYLNQHSCLSYPIKNSSDPSPVITVFNPSSFAFLDIKYVPICDAFSSGSSKYFTSSSNVFLAISGVIVTHSIFVFKVFSKKLTYFSSSTLFGIKRIEIGTLYFEFEFFNDIAVIIEESSPPEKNIPPGTSE